MKNEFLAASALWGTCLTIGAYSIGLFLNRKTKSALFNPLLWACIFVAGFLLAAHIPYQTYKAGTGLVSSLLLPATVSLAIPLYEKWELLRKNVTAVLAGILMGTLTSMGGVCLLALGFGLDHVRFATLLPKSVTTAIGMDVASEMGGIPALTGAVIILTGIVGNILAEPVCQWFHITDPVAKGVGIGTASHAIGTSRAMEMGDVEGAMSSLAIAVAGIMTAILSPIVVGVIQ